MTPKNVNVGRQFIYMMASEAISELTHILTNLYKCEDFNIPLDLINVD